MAQQFGKSRKLFREKSIGIESIQQTTEPNSALQRMIRKFRIVITISLNEISIRIYQINGLLIPLVALLAHLQSTEWILLV